jgi:hypothetical protein
MLRITSCWSSKTLIRQRKTDQKNRGMQRTIALDRSAWQVQSFENLYVVDKHDVQTTRRTGWMIDVTTARRHGL